LTSNRVTQIIRAVYPSTSRPFAERIDKIVLKAALHATGMSTLAEAPPDDAERIRVAQRMHLPVANGGMGIYSCAANVDAAFMGNAALTCSTVQSLGLNPAAEDSPSSGTAYVAEIRAALARVQSRLPYCDEIKQRTSNRSCARANRSCSTSSQPSSLKKTSRRRELHFCHTRGQAEAC
jgi:hypothetical protein